MNDVVDVLEVVALTEDLPERGLYRGWVGTVVEFSGDDDRAHASLALETNQ